MRIETDVKLDYKDVLIRPKRSTLRSRKEVSLNREYSFRNSGRKWNGVPIMAANMDGVGTFDMQDALAEHGLFTCMVKHYSVEDWTSRLGSYMDWDRLPYPQEPGPVIGNAPNKSFKNINSTSSVST